MKTQKPIALLPTASVILALMVVATSAQSASADESILFGIQLSGNYQDYTIYVSSMVEDTYGLNPFYQVYVSPPERNPGFEYYTITFDKETSKIHEVQAENFFANEETCQEAADNYNQLLKSKFGGYSEKYNGVYGQSRQYVYYYYFEDFSGYIRCLSENGFETWLLIGIETNQLWETRVKNFEKF